MLRDSLVASTLAKVSIGGKMCHMGKMHHMKITPKEEQAFIGLDCGTPDPHLRSDNTLTGMRAGCCTSDWKWGPDKLPKQ